MSFDWEEWVPVFWIVYIIVGLGFLFFYEDPHKEIMIGIALLLGFINLYHHQVMRAITKRGWTL